MLASGQAFVPRIYPQIHMLSERLIIGWYMEVMAMWSEGSQKFAYNWLSENVYKQAVVVPFKASLLDRRQDISSSTVGPDSTILLATLLPTKIAAT